MLALGVGPSPDRCLFPPPDKNFEDDDSVDGGRSSSSSKGASLSGRKPVSMGSFRRPTSASGNKSAGQSPRGHMTRLLTGAPNPKNKKQPLRDHGGACVCAGRDGSGAGAVDEEDFIQAFEDVPTVQVGRLRPILDIFSLFFPALSHSSHRFPHRSTPTGRWRRP